jgi:two-component system sensor histidine kinase DesK
VARRILYVVMFAYFVNGIINIRLQSPRHGAQFWLTLGCMAAAFGFGLSHIRASAPRWPAWQKTLSLGLQATLTYLPFFALHETWGGMAGFVAGSCLLLVRRPLAWVFFGLIMVSMVLFAEVTFHSADWISYYLAATMILGLVVFGMTRLSQLVAQLSAMRGELTRMAVVQERLRFARDLHDLLGYSLSSITLKSELAYRLVQHQPERAQRELAEILEAARQALADVREVASGYRDMVLATEVDSAQRMLETVGVHVVVRFELGDLLPDVNTVLATTLRESVTNILRHSKVQHCRITATRTDGRIRLEVANDGVANDGDANSTPARAEGARSRAEAFDRTGSGLDNLRGRLAAFGGCLIAGVGPDRWFRVVAEIPRTRDATGSGGARGGQDHQAAPG